MVALIFFYLVFPVLVIFVCMQIAFFNRIGAVLICYVTGAVLGNIGILPASAAGIQDGLSSASVAIALPLLLFSMDVKAWTQMAGKAILSMMGATVMIAAVASLGSLWMAERVPEAWKLAGLAVGVYTGGTPNLAAIKIALDVDAATYIILHTYDMVISLIYIVFCITIAQRMMHRFLPKFQLPVGVKALSEQAQTEDINLYKGMFTPRVLKGLGLALLASLVILGTAVVLAGLVPHTYSTAVIMLVITTFGIGASFVPKIRHLEKTFQLGMYIILVFCLTVGSMARIQDLVNVNWLLLGYIVFCVFGTFFLHALFCRFMKIDTDTFIITSTAAICSPPFVPVVAGAINNRQIILSGLTTGIIGYAIGNYLGIGIAYLVRAMTG